MKERIIDIDNVKKFEDETGIQFLFENPYSDYHYVRLDKKHCSFEFELNIELVEPERLALKDIGLSSGSTKYLALYNLCNKLENRTIVELELNDEHTAYKPTKKHSGYTFFKTIELETV